MMNSKKQMVDFLKAKFDEVTDISITDALAKYLGEIKETPKEKFSELVALVEANLATPVAIENSPIAPAKKKGSIKKKEAPAPVENSAATAEVLPEPTGDIDIAVKKTGKLKKSTAKAEKPEKKPDPVPQTETVGKTTLAKIFPEEFTNEAGTFKVDFEIKTLEDLQKAISAGKEIVFGFYWSKRLLKQFNYDAQQVLKKGTVPKEFPNDLDLLTPLHISSDCRFAYVISLYTELAHFIRADEMKIDEGMRFVNGIEMNIYIRQ